MSYLWYWPGGGWDFEAWKAQCPWTPVTGPQTGTMALLHPLEGISSKAAWEKARAEWFTITDAILGKGSDTKPETPEMEVLSSEKVDSYLRKRVRYRLTPEEWGYAWYLRPLNAEGKLPAVIALHQTHELGKDEPVGLVGDPTLAYGKELAEQGYVVFAPDVLAFGERRKDHENAMYHNWQQFFGAHPQGSVMGKMVYDIHRAVDLMECLPTIDPARIGCIGHSHGGYGTLFAMLYEPRIQAGVISCGVTIMRSDPKPQRWWRNTALMPRLGHYEQDISQTPLDFHYWLAMIAPHPLMLSAALKDGIFPDTDNLKDVSRMLEEIYAFHGNAGGFQPYIFDGEHNFPEEAREQAYAMFDSVLKA